MSNAAYLERAKCVVRALLAIFCVDACSGEDLGVGGDTRADANDEVSPIVDANTDTTSDPDTLPSSDAPSDIHAEAPAFGPDGVLQYHKNPSRDGLYVDPAFTKEAVDHLHIDPTFHAPIQGPTYSQPLYFDAGPGGKDLVIAATEQNLVYGFDAANGSVLWQKKLGDPVARAALPCGNIDPLGITGTPVIDGASRRIFVDAMTTPDGGTTKKHLLFALSLGDGSISPGWPLDVSATVKDSNGAFDSAVHNQRGALALINGVLYVPYGGHGGDCGAYRGRVLAVPIDDPSSVKSFSTRAIAGGIWAPSGLASDGTSIFAATGNTKATDIWGHGEAILRLGAGATFSDQTRDYFAPSDWKALDDTDTDLGGTGPVLLDVPGATPGQLVVAHGKNGVAYLIDRTNLGGIGKGNGATGEGVASSKVSMHQIINAAAAYRTAQAAYVVSFGNGTACPGPQGDLTALRISATAPPQISIAWCGYQASNASPMVTTTDGHSDAIVWGIGAGSTNRLVGFDGDTGQTVFAGGGPNDAMSNVRGLATAIAAKGRIFVAADAGVFAFTTR